jgi:hypothetical protein
MVISGGPSKPEGHFPTGQAALRRLYLALMILDPTGKGRQGGPADGRPRSTPSMDVSQRPKPTNKQNEFHR